MKKTFSLGLILFLLMVALFFPTRAQSDEIWFNAQGDFVRIEKNQNNFSAVLWQNEQQLKRVANCIINEKTKIIVFDYPSPYRKYNFTLSSVIFLKPLLYKVHQQVSVVYSKNPQTKYCSQINVYF